MMIVTIILMSSVTVDGFNFYISKKRCLLHNKTCVQHCPRYMHPYHTRCDVDTMSQRTCASKLIYTIGYTCGWSRCDCNGDLVLDEETGTCVKENDCPVEFGRRKNKIRRPKKRFGLSKKLRLRDYEDPFATS